MNATISKILADHLAALPWVDKVGGLVRKQVISKDGQDFFFPVDECVDDCDQSLFPDDSKRSIIYFEDRGFDVRGGCQDEFTSKLRLVFWGNSKGFDLGQCDNITDLLMVHLMNELEQVTGNQGLLKGIRVLFRSGPARNTGIFSQYRYDETCLQYLMPPYFAFALDLEVKYSVNYNACLDCAVLPDLDIANIDC